MRRKDESEKDSHDTASPHEPSSRFSLNKQYASFGPNTTAGNIITFYSPNDFPVLVNFQCKVGVTQSNQWVCQMMPYTIQKRTFSHDEKLKFNLTEIPEKRRQHHTT